MMANCPQCNQPTLFSIKSQDPSVLAKCRKCGYYRYRRIKMTVEEFENIIYSLVEQMQKKSNNQMTIEECLAFIVKRTGHTTEEVTGAYNNARHRTIGF